MLLTLEGMSVEERAELKSFIDGALKDSNGSMPKQITGSADLMEKSFEEFPCIALEIYDDIYEPGTAQKVYDRLKGSIYALRVEGDLLSRDQVLGRLEALGAPSFGDKALVTHSDNKAAGSQGVPLIINLNAKNDPATFWMYSGATCFSFGGEGAGQIDVGQVATTITGTINNASRGINTSSPLNDITVSASDLLFSGPIAQSLNEFVGHSTQNGTSVQALGGNNNGNNELSAHDLQNMTLSE